MTAVSLLPTPRLQFTDADGAPLVGGTVATYIPGTFTQSMTWQDSLGTIPNANPITLDAIGSASIWGNGSYRMIVMDVNGNLIFDAITTAPALSTTTLQDANNLSDLTNAAAARTNLGLGTAAVQNIGTSGANVPLLNGSNAWSGSNTFSAAASFTGPSTLSPSGAPFSGIGMGYIGTPRNAQSANYTLALTDQGAEIFFSATCNLTIPTNASVAFPIGTVIKLTWDQTYTGSVVAAGGVTLRWPVGNVTGTRTVTGPGYALISYEKSNEWWISGLNVT